MIVESQGDRASAHRVSMMMRRLGNIPLHRTTVADELTKQLSLGDQR